MRQSTLQAAGVDLGAHEMVACGPDGADQPIVRTLGTDPADLQTLADWLVDRGMQTVANETRLGILTLLLDDEATVSDMVTRLGLPQPRVSTALAQLCKAGVVSVAMAGRQRVYRVDAGRIQAVLHALQALAPMTSRRSPQATREVRGNTAIRQARTCYDHLAGVIGVQLLEEMFRRAWLAQTESQEHTRRLYRLTPHGAQALRERNVDIAHAQKARRQFAFGCLDWTERREHLGGALGAAILEAMVTAGIMRRQPSTRTVVFLKPVMDWLDAASSDYADAPEDRC